MDRTKQKNLMFDAIKSLSVQQRLFAFIFAIAMSSIVALLTVYMKTDDCSEISNQYTEVIRNQSDLMTVNTEILDKYNNARRDFLIIQDQLIALQENLQNVRSERVTVIERVNQYSMVDTVAAMVSSPEPIVRYTPLNEGLTSSIDSMLMITGKYSDDE